MQKKNDLIKKINRVRIRKPNKSEYRKGCIGGGYPLFCATQFKFVKNAIPLE